MHIILAGAFGGMLAPLLRVALAFVQQEDVNLDFKLLYWFGVIILGALGAGVAWGFRETKRQKAILLGLSLPAFLSLTVSDLQHGAERARKGPRITSTGFSFVSSAYAAPDSKPLEPPPSNDLVQPQRTLAVRSLNSETDVSIAFLSDSNNSRLTVALPAKATLQVPIPEDAITVQFSVGNNVSKPYPLSTSPGVLAIDLKTSSRVKFDWGSAFGGKPKTSVDFEVTPWLDPPRRSTARYLFYGIENQDGWYERHFERADSSPSAKPTVGVTVRALDSVHIRSDVITYVPDQGWTNAPQVGVVSKGQLVRVLEVIHIPDNENFIWVRFDPL